MKDLVDFIMQNLPAKLYHCELCNKSFANQLGLDIHRRRMHKVHKPHATRTLTYCPCCGTNIRLIMQALAAVEDLGDEG